jgi:hypothetical protein
LFHPAAFELDHASACETEADPAVALLRRHHDRRSFAVDVSGLDRRVTRLRGRPRGRGPEAQRDEFLLFIVGKAGLGREWRSEQEVLESAGRRVTLRIVLGLEPLDRGQDRLR